MRLKYIVFGTVLFLNSSGCGGSAVQFANSAVSDHNSIKNRPNENQAVWETVFRDDAIGLESINFSDDRHGIATGASEVYLVTEDGGTTWTKHRIGDIEKERLGATYNLTQSATLPSGSIYIIGNLEETGGALFTSLDQGQTWNIKYFPNTSLDGISASKTRVWIVGNDKDSGFVLRREDNGSWKKVWKGGRGQYLSGLDFVDDSHGWAVGTLGWIIHTNDGGDSWIIQPSSKRENLLGVRFADSENGYAVGTKGIIVRTRNGGKEWLETESPTNETMTAIGIRSANESCALGLSGSIFCTTDGGNTWTRTSLPDGPPASFITVTSLGRWLVANGSIFRSLSIVAKE